MAGRGKLEFLGSEGQHMSDCRVIVKQPTLFQRNCSSLLCRLSYLDFEGNDNALRSDFGLDPHRSLHLLELANPFLGMFPFGSRKDVRCFCLPRILENKNGKATIS